MKSLGIDKQAYMQGLVIKRTCESVLIDFRVDLTSEVSTDNIDQIMIDLPHVWKADRTVDIQDSIFVLSYF